MQPLRKGIHKQGRGSSYYTTREQKKQKISKIGLSQHEKAKVQGPKTFTLKSDDPGLPLRPSFVVALQIQPSPPVKQPTKADALKYKITPVNKIWSSLIRPALNDSEFVQIYRRGKNIKYGELQYGRSIIDYSGELGQSRVFSRAYFKLLEILDLGITADKKQPIRIACIAEGPGGFIHSLIDYRQRSNIRDQFYAITLKINESTRNASDWSDSRCQHILNGYRARGWGICLSYGALGTGDLLRLENIDSFAEEDLQYQKCWLVTADGGIECITEKQYDYQQVFNAKLFLAEIVTALKIQQPGGTFIMKIYNIQFQLTQQLLLLLCIYYRGVRIVKPATSRPGNEEKYLVCEGFLGIKEVELQQLRQLLRRWTQVQPNVGYFQHRNYVMSALRFEGWGGHSELQAKIKEINSYFINEQIEKLEVGLSIVADSQCDEVKIVQYLQKHRYRQQLHYSMAWCQKYKIPHVQLK